MNFLNQGIVLAFVILLSLLVGFSTSTLPVVSNEPTSTSVPAEMPNPKANLPTCSEIIKTYPAGVE